MFIKNEFVTYFASSPWCLQRDCEDICFIALMCRDVLTLVEISQVQINRTRMGGGGGVSPPSPVIQHILE